METGTFIPPLPIKDLLWVQENTDNWTEMWHKDFSNSIWADEFPTDCCVEQTLMTLWLKINVTQACLLDGVVSSLWTVIRWNRETKL